MKHQSTTPKTPLTIDIAFWLDTHEPFAVIYGTDGMATCYAENSVKIFNKDGNHISTSYLSLEQWNRLFATTKAMSKDWANDFDKLGIADIQING